jgi:hypothetical protein
MTRIGLATALIVPVALAACNRTPPPPEPVPLTAAESACAAAGANAAGVDAATVSVTPTSSTKTGETIYTVVANGVGYNCVVGPDNVVASFSPQ